MQSLQTIRNKIGRNATFVAAVAAAAIVGGATTALVSAAIPDSTGTIHGCYGKAAGNLRVIDTSAGKSCTNAENSITWPNGVSSSTNNRVQINTGDVFNDTSLAFEDLSGKNLTNTTFTNADLTNANFSNVTLSGAAFDGIRGNQVKFNNVNFTQLARFTNPVIGRSEFKAAVFTGMSIDHANMNGSNFSSSKFNNTTLDTVDLSTNDFTNADFSNASLNNVNLTGSTMNSANISGATWIGVSCPDGTISDAHGNTCAGHLNP